MHIQTANRLKYCKIVNDRSMNEMIISFAGGKKVNADYRGFTIETDQSVRNGGEGSAPEPFSLFLASIGTCAGIYVYSFCRERDLSTRDIRIIQTHHRKADGNGIGKISIDIEVPEDFPEKYRKTLAKVAGLCAVKKHILNPPVFEVATKVAENG